MKKLKNYIPGILIWMFVALLPFGQSGCNSSNPVVTLAPGGVYKDPAIYASDKAITDADDLLLSLLAWYDANKTFLAKYPEVGAVAEKARAGEKQWVLDAFAAQDAYRSAAKAYKDALAIAAEQPADPNLSADAAAKQAAANAKLATFSAAVAVITNLTQQLVAYQAAHSHA